MQRRESRRLDRGLEAVFLACQSVCKISVAFKNLDIVAKRAGKLCGVKG
jgi:hypothetical protein